MYSKPKEESYSNNKILHKVYFGIQKYLSPTHKIVLWTVGREKCHNPKVTDT